MNGLQLRADNSQHDCNILPAACKMPSWGGAAETGFGLKAVCSRMHSRSMTMQTTLKDKLHLIVMASVTSPD